MDLLEEVDRIAQKEGRHSREGKGTGANDGRNRSFDRFRRDRHGRECTEASGAGEPAVQSGGTGTAIEGASVPPSTWKIFPVTQDEAGEAR